MARTDYYQDPNAPVPNSVVPSASAVVIDDQGRILLIKRSDNQLWALPGGGHDVGESIEEAAIREVKEETGLNVEITGLVGVYTNPDHVIAYTNGEVHQQFSLCFTTTLCGGQLAIDDESTDIAWTLPDDIADLPITHPCGSASSTTFSTDLSHIWGDTRLERARHLRRGARALNPRHRGQQRPFGRTHRPMYRIVSTIAVQHFGDSILNRYRTAIRSDSHIAIRHPVKQIPGWPGKCR